MESAGLKFRRDRTGPTVVGAAVGLLVLAISSVAGATVMTYMDTAELVDKSDVIVRGEVSSLEMVEDDRGAFRHTSVAVDETYMGDARETVTVEQWGGAVSGSDGAEGEVTRTVPGDATFEKGEEVVLFLRRGDSRHDRDDVLYLTGLAQSKWSVQREGDGATVMRDLSDLGIVPKDGDGGIKKIGEEYRSLASFEASLESLIYAEQGESAQGGDQ